MIWQFVLLFLDELAVALDILDDLAVVLDFLDDLAVCSALFR
jgi:hypothetical protein